MLSRQRKYVVSWSNVRTACKGWDNALSVKISLPCPHTFPPTHTQLEAAALPYLLRKWSQVKHHNVRKMLLNIKAGSWSNVWVPWIVGVYQPNEALIWLFSTVSLICLSLGLHIESSWHFVLLFGFSRLWIFKSLSRAAHWILPASTILATLLQTIPLLKSCELPFVRLYNVDLTLIIFGVLQRLPNLCSGVT